MKKSQQEIINLIKAIPEGKVATYGQIAGMAGHYPSVRQVVWALHSSSGKEGLSWHRVVNAKGGISLKPGAGYEKQMALLEEEGIVFNEKGRLDLERYQWDPDGDDLDGDFDG